MPVKGTFTALQKLKPIEVDFGKVAESGNKRQDIVDAKKAAAAKVRQEARDKIDFDVLEPIITGVDSFDEAATLGIQGAANAQHESFKRALNDPTYADSAEYKILTKNLNNYSKNIEAGSAALKEIADTITQRTLDGTVSPWDNELLETLNGAYVTESTVFSHNQDGTMKATIALTDQSLITKDNPKGFVKDEDGKIKMKQTNLAELLKGLGAFSVTPDSDIIGEAKIIGELLGKSVTSEIDGFTITSEQAWETKKEGAMDMVKSALGSASAPTPLAKKLWAGEMERSSRELTESDMKEIEEFFLEKVKPVYDEEVKKTKNFSAQESARTRAQKRTEGNVTPEYVVDPSTGQATITQVNGVDANIISFGDGKGISVISTEARKESIQNIYVDAEGGIYADKIQEFKAKGDPVYIQGKPETVENIDHLATALTNKAKGWKTTAEPKVRMTDKDFTNLAKNPKMVDDKGNRFKDGRELKVFLEKRKELLPKGEKLKGIGSKYN